MSELESILEEDINLLVNQLARPDTIDRAALRVSASTIARRWIIDGQLATLGREIGSVPKLPAIETDQHVAAIEKDREFQFYIAGGACINGLPINSLYAHGKDREEAEETRLSVPSMKYYTLSKFRARKCAFFLGQFFTVEDVIRFVANKTGGAHFDTKRDKFVDQKAEKARHFFLLGSNPADQPEDHDGPYAFVPGMPPGLWNFTHIEMLSIAQSLCNVQFGETPFVQFRNLDEAPDSPNQDILLGIRNVRAISLDEDSDTRWILPENLQNYL